MSETPQITVKTVVVCDQVRREDNGKEMLIGVYSAGILVAQLPAPLMLSFWIQFKSTDVGETAVLFRLMGGEDVKFAEMHIQMQLLRPGMGSMTIGPIGIMLQVVTSLTLQMKQGDQDWATIEEISVEKGDAPVNPLTGAPISFVQPEIRASLP
jgi:hypothetical protein